MIARRAARSVVARRNALAMATTLAAMAAAASCGDVGDGAAGSETAAATSSVVGDDALLWVASPDDATLVAVDAETLETAHAVSLPFAPHHLARQRDNAGGSVFVATSLAATGVAVVTSATTPRGGAGADGSPSSASDTVRTVEVPCGGTWGVVFANAGGAAVVTCPHDARVVVVDANPGLGTVRATVTFDGRPTAIAVADGRVWVTDSAGGRLRSAPVAELLRRRDAPWVPASVAWRDEALPVASGRTASTADALAFVGGQPIVAFQSVENDGDRDRPPVDGAYGAVVDGSPRFDPRLSGPCDGGYARFDGRERVFSGPAAVAAAGGYVWVAHMFTRNVAVLRCEVGSDGLLSLVASFRVGHGARGLVLSEDGRRAWVDVGFDHAVARLELPASPIFEAAAAATQRRDVTPLLSPRAQAGRRRFHDATDPQLTPSGVVACASCHPGGGDDGLRWFLHTPHIARKLRRTPVAWAISPGERLHWDGAFATSDALVSATVRDLMGGLALGLDPGEMSAWMAETPTPPPRPLRADEAAEVERGRALFFDDDVGCATCHIDAIGTDAALHTVTAPSADPDAALDAARTPALHAVRGRPPYLHDGRAATLAEVVGAHNAGDRHGRTSHLSPSDLAALVAFVGSL